MFLLKPFNNNRTPIQTQKARQPLRFPSVLRAGSKMSSSKPWVYYPIKGIPVKNTETSSLSPKVEVPIRQNIEHWSNDPANAKQVTLFILALDRFQKISPEDRDSYFQIAGIHGQPNVPWDEPIDAAEAAGKGYCTHNNILFPIWHRAYLALYEVLCLLHFPLKEKLADKCKATTSRDHDRSHYSQLPA
jgi:hypothetical protein